MSAVIKFLIGAALTALVGFAAHEHLGFGSRYIDGLESASRTALGNAGGAGMEVRFERQPALRRIAILSGPADAEQQRRLIAAIRAVPGVADARWANVPSAADRDAATARAAATVDEEGNAP